VNYIRSLQESVKTGLLSNAFREIRTWLEEKWQIADAFDQILISAEEGIAKPDKRIYHLALERLGAKPEETVFIDDAQVNVQAANDIGMQGVLFRSPEASLQQVEAILKHSGTRR
jgi:putative hydrolase of the HAD superfamily